jgi:hypothetical protein
MDLSGQLHAPAALIPGRIPCYPLDMRLVEPQSRSGRGDKEKKRCRCRKSNPGSTDRSLFTILKDSSALLSRVEK